MARPRVTQVDAALDAAARRLSAQGVAGFAVDDVAEELGVSRATVYRYLGSRNEIIAAVIQREGQQLLDTLRPVIPTASSLRELVAALVVGAAQGIDRSPVLSRLSTDDLRDSVEFVTVDAGPLIAAVVSVLSAAITDAAAFDLDGIDVELAAEEATRLLLSHLTTPRRDGGRLDTDALGERVAVMVAAASASQNGRDR